MLARIAEKPRPTPATKLNPGNFGEKQHVVCRTAIFSPRFPGGGLISRIQMLIFLVARFTIHFVCSLSDFCHFLSNLAVGS